MVKTVKVAAAQMAPVFMDRDATVDKICGLIAEAGAEGAKLIAFPETIIPGYPYWAQLLDPMATTEFNRELVKQSVDIPGPATEALCAAAKAADCYAVIGVNEREGGTLYNTQIFIGSDGQIMGKRRKLVPTYHERMIWGRGDNADLPVFTTPLATLGGLICAEHSNALFRYALQAQGEQVHLANWPGGIKRLMPIMEIAIRSYAWEAQVFVINATGIVTPEIIDYLGEGGSLDLLEPGLGFSAIVGPWGEYIAGPETDKEVVLYADLDFDRIVDVKRSVDSIGHYARPDVVRLLLRRSETNQRPIVFEDVDTPRELADGIPEN